MEHNSDAIFGSKTKHYQTNQHTS